MASHSSLLAWEVPTMVPVFSGVSDSSRPRGPQPAWLLCLWDSSSSTLATWCEELTHLKWHRCWERLKAGGEGDDRGWGGWMASPTRWTWVWASSGSWWWTGRPGMLQFMGSQRVGRDRDWTREAVAFPGGSVGKNLPAAWETRVWSLGQEDPLEEETATHSSLLAWRIPWTEAPGALQSVGSQRVGYDSVTQQQPHPSGKSRLHFPSSPLPCSLPGLWASAPNKLSRGWGCRQDAFTQNLSEAGSRLLRLGLLSAGWAAGLISSCSLAPVLAPVWEEQACGGGGGTRAQKSHSPPRTEGSKCVLP